MMQRPEAGNQRLQDVRRRLNIIAAATDFSDGAVAAVGWATDLALRHSADLVLIHAVDVESLNDPSALQLADRLIQNALESAKLGVTARGVAARHIHRCGRPWQVISSVAEEVNADLLVIGAHGRTTPSERVLGTVADRVIRTTSTPVVVHRRANDGAAQGLQTVLAATDFSAEASSAIDVAVGLLACPGQRSRLELLHAVALPACLLEPAVPMPELGCWDELEWSAAQRLEEIASRLRSDLLRVDVKATRGDVAEAVLQEAAACDADLIAIGTEGRSGIGRFLLGSMAEKVLRRADRPVLIVRRRRDGGSPPR